MTGTQCSLLPTGIMLEACALLETVSLVSRRGTSQDNAAGDPYDVFAKM